MGWVCLVCSEVKYVLWLVIVLSLMFLMNSSLLFLMNSILLLMLWLKVVCILCFVCMVLVSLLIRKLSVMLM